MKDNFTDLDLALDEESWDWLNLEHPEIATKVKAAVANGASPEEVKNRVLKRAGTHRVKFAARCENAARYLRHVAART